MDNTELKEPINKPLKETILKDPDVDKVKFEVYGQEIIEKLVKQTGNSGRVYLPPSWIGHNVKIIKIT